ncbi:MAG: DUF3471 domain-containing protein, partial [bacterium]|nr:DUF3471 domain-containing protein [bacterium]
YLKRYQAGQERSQKRQKEKEEEWAKKSANGPRPNLDDFTGLYGGPMYGDATISKKDQYLVLKLLPAPIFTSDLSHLYFDTFKLKLRGDFSFIPSGTGTVQFLRDKKGNVTEMIVDIPNYDLFFTELEFKKKKKK